MQCRRCPGGCAGSTHVQLHTPGRTTTSGDESMPIPIICAMTSSESGSLKTLCMNGSMNPRQSVRHDVEHRGIRWGGPAQAACRVRSRRLARRAGADSAARRTAASAPESRDDDGPPSASRRGPPAHRRCGAGTCSRRRPVAGAGATRVVASHRARAARGRHLVADDARIDEVPGRDEEDGACRLPYRCQAMRVPFDARRDSPRDGLRAGDHPRIVGAGPPSLTGTSSAPP